MANQKPEPYQAGEDLKAWSKQMEVYIESIAVELNSAAATLEAVNAMHGSNTAYSGLHNRFMPPSWN
jgi:hypothetical protein